MSEQSHLERPDRHRQRLYEVLANDDLSLSDKQTRALSIGREFLGVDNAHVEQLVEDGETLRVIDSVGDEALAPVGTRLDRSVTFCRRTLEEGSALAVSDADSGRWAGDPAAREQGLGCYLGAPMDVDGETFGTVCFVSEVARPETFGDDERAFAELVARLLGRERELHQREQELDARERALDRSERKYESLLAAAPDAVFLVDAGTRTIVEANEAAVELTGYEPEQLSGLHVEAIHPEGDAERYRRLARRLTAPDEDGTRTTHSTFDDGTPLEIQRRDGARVPVEMSVTTLTLDGERYAQAIVRDISDRRQREQDLRLRDRAMDRASVGITIADADDPDLPLVYANPAFGELTGYDPEDVRDRNCRFLQGPETDDGTVRAIRESLADGEPITTEIRNYRADGTLFWNELSVAPVTDGASETTHFVGFQRDVTERKRRQRLISVLNRVLRHNLRNKTNVVLGHAAELADRVETDGLAARIESAATDLAELGDKVHDLQRAVGDDADPGPADVVAPVERAVADCRSDHPTVAVEVEAPEHVRAITPPRLRLAVRELIDNAVEHGDGPVGVTVTGEEGGGVAISVSDGGPGLPENERTVLRRGYETALEHGGGLGLALVTWIVTGAGGHVRSTVGDGTTVTIHLRGADEDG